MKKLISYMKGLEWLYAGIFAVFVCLQVALSLRIPQYMSGITDLLQQDAGNLSRLLSPAVGMLLCSLGSILFAVISGYCLSYASANIMTRMREDLFTHLMSFNLAEMKNFESSSLITRCTSDMEQVRTFITLGVQALVQCPLTVIIAVTRMRGNGSWMWAVTIAALLLAAITVLLFLLSLPQTTRMQKLIDSVNRLTREHLSGLRVVHAYNGYRVQQDQFSGVNDDLAKTSVSANRYTGALSPFFSLNLNGLTLVIYVLGSAMILSMGSVAEKQEAFSQMVVFASYALQAFSAFAMLVIVFTGLPRLLISLRRIVEVADTNLVIKNGKATGGANGQIGTVEFRNVSFAYPGSEEYALKDLSFTVNRGQTLAIIGATGSGKTTLMNLIMRFYDVSEGAVFVDGRDVRDYDLWALRDKIGYVPQKSFLFAGTIAANIDYGHKTGLEATLAEVQKAAEVGQSREFIEQKTGQYEAPVEEGGANFSGGQRQRLTISRAICRDPEIYLFDDSFSALDFKTDATLRKKLREHAGSATQIIVGQRVGSILHADQILVLEKGELVGRGRHEELLASCPVYREIVRSQQLGEEVSA